MVTQNSRQTWHNDLCLRLFTLLELFTQLESTDMTNSDSQQMNRFAIYAENVWLTFRQGSQFLISRPVNNCPKISCEAILRYIYWWCNLSIGVFCCIFRLLLSGLHSLSWLILNNCSGRHLQSLRRRDSSWFIVQVWRQKMTVGWQPAARYRAGKHTWTADSHDGQRVLDGAVCQRGASWKTTKMRWDEMRWDEMRWDEMRWDEMRWDEMRWDEMRWDEMRWDEMRWDEMRWDEEGVSVACCTRGLSLFAVPSRDTSGFLKHQLWWTLWTSAVLVDQVPLIIFKVWIMSVLCLL